MLVALSNWGFEASSDVLALVLGIGLPVVAMAAWGMFVSPKARVRLPELPRQGVAMAMFALGAVALAASGYPVFAVLFALVAILNTALLYRWRL